MSFTPTTAKEGVCPVADIGAKQLEISRHTALPTMCRGSRRGANLCMTASRILRERFDVKRSFSMLKIGYIDHNFGFAIRIWAEPACRPFSKQPLLDIFNRPPAKSDPRSLAGRSGASRDETAGFAFGSLQVERLLRAVFAKQAEMLVVHHQRVSVLIEIEAHRHRVGGSADQDPDPCRRSRR